jgi:gliding motility-associated-like protein
VLFPIGTTTVTWTATDAAGNTATATQVVTVVDVTAPLIAAPATVNVSTDASSCFATNVSLGTPIVTDNCTIQSVTNNAPISFSVGSTTVIWTATDIYGNVSTAMQTVVVTDIIAPVAITQNITVSLNAQGLAVITANQINNGSNDNCSDVTLSVAPSSFTCGQIGINPVVLTVTDASGNVTTATAQVTVTDNQAPTAIVNNMTVTLNANGTGVLSASQVNNGSFDNCAVQTISISQTTFDCGDLGNNVIIFTVTDTSGNSTTANVNVLVVDTIAPIVVTQNITLDVTFEESVTITPEQISVGTTDNCGISFMTLSQDTFGCSDFGVNTVILTVVDESGNESTAEFTVTVNRCTVRVSEAVTPNGDGINDTWVIQNIDQYANNRVRVFNRWGDKVFESKGYLNTWDGTYKNRTQKLPEGASYYYQIDLEDDGKIDQDGWIYITR